MNMIWTVKDIESLVGKKSRAGWAIVVSVVEARRKPSFNMGKLEKDGRVVWANSSKFIARQQVPKIYNMNASLYAYSLAF